MAWKSKGKKQKCAKIELMLVGYTGGSRVFYANENRFLSKWGSFECSYTRVSERAALGLCVKVCHVIRWRGNRAWLRWKGSMSSEEAGPFHALPLFTDANVLPLNFLYYQTISNLMHVHYSKVPSGILNLFQKTSSCHFYNTRASAPGNFYVNS